MTDPTYSTLPVPAVRRHRKGHPSVVWIVPILACIAAATLGIRAYVTTGPTIRVTFETADGLEAGKSEVRFRNVPIGKVDRITLSADHRHIIATVKLAHDVASLAARDTRFWVERPRIGVAGVTGLGTLVSGGYIGVDAGASSETTDTFVGLERPPGVTADQRGRRFRLTTNDAGSLTLRSPVYLRHIAVGWISALDLASDGKRATAEVFIQHPFEDTVTASTVFWNASGMDVTIDAGGLHLNTQSLATVVAGGLAYDVRDPDAPDRPATADSVFALFDDRAHAMAHDDGVRVATTMRFHDSLRGVGVGAALDLQGVTIGQVDALRPGYDRATRTFFTDIDATVFPARLGQAFATLTSEGNAAGKSGVDMLGTLVDRGLRAQIRSGNLLTGQGYIALAWFPRAKLSPVAAVDGIWSIPTERGGVDRMQEQAQEIVAKLDAIPFDAIGKDAARAIATLRESATALRDNVAAPDSAIQQTTRATLEQLQRAAFSLRGLADYLQQHPESMLRGRGGK